jgi:perosamine synthetase
MITTDDRKLYEKLRRVRWMGITKDTWSRSKRKNIYAWQYWINELGFKAHLNDIAATIGLVQLDRLDDMIKKRRRIVKIYNEAFRPLFPVKTPPEKKDVRHSWCMYHIKIPQRDKLIGFLKEKGIAPGVHYYPIHMHPVYRHLKASCPVAERVWRDILTLPLYPDLPVKDVKQVIKTVKEFVSLTDWKDIRLEADRVILRKIDSSDLPMMRKWRNKNRYRFFDHRFISKEMMENWFNDYLKKQTERMFVIETKKGRGIGMIGLYDIDTKNKDAQIGRIIIGDPRFKHREYATEATERLVKYAFKSLRFQRVYLKVFADNKYAIRLYQRCGFKKEGILRKAAFKKGKHCDVVIMAIVR